MPDVNMPIGSHESDRRRPLLQGPPALLRALLALLLLALPACASGTIKKGNANAPTGTGFVTRTLIQGDHHRKYSVFIPHAYRNDRRWPVIIFLHGIGEAGSSAQANLRVGLAPAIAKQANTFPFIAVFPQSTGGWGKDSQAAADVMAALYDVSRTYSVDPDRIYLTGVSTGGYGTWALGSRYNTTFAAIAPLCAFSPEDDLIPGLTSIPVWAFHNAGDPFVLAAGTASTCSKINKAGGYARYTEFGAMGHNCWDAAYNDPAFYQWLLRHRRGTITAQTRGVPAATITPATPNTPAAPPIVHSPTPQPTAPALIPPRTATPSPAPSRTQDRVPPPVW